MACSGKKRDTPVQWSSEKNAGFTTGTPWLKVNSNYPDINVENQENDLNSVLHYYRRLIALRKSDAYKEVFTYGDFVPAYENANDVMAYYRVDGENRVLVVANFGEAAMELPLEYGVKDVLLSNRTEPFAKKTWNANETLTLEHCEVMVLSCV